MEHVRSGLQTCMKDAHEPHLSKMERLNKKINESIKEGKATDEKLQKVNVSLFSFQSKAVNKQE